VSARLWQRALALACAVCLAGAAGAAVAASNHRTALHGTTSRRTHAKSAAKHACRRRHGHRRCAPSQKHKSPSGVHTQSGAVTPTTPATGARTPTTPSPAGAGGGSEPGIPTKPPSEAPLAGGSPPPQGPGHVQVSAREFSFTLSRPAVGAGSFVLELVNAGQDEHDLHIRPAAGGADVGAVGIVLPGHHADVEFNLPPGSYTLYCAMPAHEELGMRATLTVE